MNREPIGLYIFRLLLGVGLFAFMCMLYWSSELIEQDMKGIRIEMNQLKNEVATLRRQGTFAPIQTNSQNTAKERPHIDPNLPNLLLEDVFYKKTLPNMLGKDFKPHGTRQAAVVGKPDNLHPFNNWSHISAWIDQCSVAVSTQLFGIYETLAIDMALKMEERKMKDSNVPEYWIHLRDNVYWDPLSPSMFPQGINLAPHFLEKHQVTAHDFKLFVDVLMNPYVQEPGAAALRNYLGDIQELEVIDDLTFVVRWKTENVTEPDGKVIPKIKYIAKLMTGTLRPLASFVYKYFPDGKKIIEDDSNPNTYRTNSVWAQNFSKHWAKNIIVSCGPWLFDGMTDRVIKFRRNPDHYNPYATLVEGMEITFKNSPENIWQVFKEAKIDTYSIQPSQLIELEEFLKSKNYQEQVKAGLAIRRLEYFDHSYSYVAWNEARVFFKNKKIRQALTMAIDRQRIIQQNLNGMGAEVHGTFFINSQANDPNISPWPFDPSEAKKLLASEGWFDSDGDGILDKEIDGKRVPFRFSLTYYVKNPTAKAISEYISTALKEIGIDCKLNGVDIADLSAIFDDKNFDALFMAWALGTPPEEPRQLWHSSGAQEKGSSNVIGFANKEIDEIISKLQFEYNKEKRIELYHKFDAIIHEEQPYTFLYTPKVTFLYREYVQNVFIPADRQDIIPGADVTEPQPSIFWLK